MNSAVQGTPFSVLQTCFWIAQMKYDFRISDAAIDAFCCLIHYLLLPAGNLFPPSYHVVKAFLGVSDGLQCVCHVCQHGLRAGDCSQTCIQNNTSITVVTSVPTVRRTGSITVLADVVNQERCPWADR